MQLPTPQSNGPFSYRGPSNPSEKRWKAYLHAKLKESLKKTSSASLFWDWSKDVKDSKPLPPEKK